MAPIVIVGVSKFASGHIVVFKEHNSELKDLGTTLKPWDHVSEGDLA